MMFSQLSKRWQNKSKAIFAYGDDDYLRKLEADVPTYYYGMNEDDDIQARNIERTTTGSALMCSMAKSLLTLYSSSIWKT